MNDDASTPGPVGSSVYRMVRRIAPKKGNNGYQH